MHCLFSVRIGALLLGIFAMARWCEAAEPPHTTTQNHTVTISQPHGPTGDLDVLIEGKPSFRLLLPEFVAAEDERWPIGDPQAFVHLIRGSWSRENGRLKGVTKVGSDLQLTVEVQPDDVHVLLHLKVTNVSDRTIKNVTANFCAGVNRLPATSPWSNRSIMPADIALNRAAQGRYWYEKITPRGLQAWNGRAWFPVHLRPRDPDASKVEPYAAKRSAVPDTRACAVPSLDGKSLFYLSWNVPCFTVAPFHGNACMHLLPRVAPTLAPGESATIVGAAGIFRGSRDELAAKLRDKLGR